MSGQKMRITQLITGKKSFIFMEGIPISKTRLRPMSIESVNGEREISPLLEIRLHTKRILEASICGKFLKSNWKKQKNGELLGEDDRILKAEMGERY
ncbi:hypothetical protein CDAR_176451 [Caerostris darwini]|uniref:Uncharacterized protein n=1 Tax=Caerostris darwini TaxID=1538125 RepID=A0AAV4Q774_9ARAC|nr:hypothetical protein CDAR_176451 [Caerostris darwini]